MSQKNNNGALELVILRNCFYRDNYKRALITLIIILVINLVLAATIFYKITNPPPPQYFPTSDDGRMVIWHPLNEPVVSDDFVLQWAGNAVRRAFSLDYLHWRQQLEDASGYFTTQGWKYFLQSLKQSNNLDTLTNLKMVSDAVITGAPVILEKAVVDGSYAWKIKLSILVTYGNVAKNIPMPMEVTMIVMRVPVEQSTDRIAINNFLPVIQQTGEQRLLQGR